MNTKFWSESLEGRDHVKDEGIDGMMILEYIRMNLTERGGEGVDWIHLTQDRDQWQALVKMVVNLQVL
jgi:hypothetical protein